MLFVCENCTIIRFFLFFLKSIYKRHLDWEPIVIKLIEAENKLQPTDKRYKKVEFQLNGK